MVALPAPLRRNDARVQSDGVQASEETRVLDLHASIHDNS